MKSVRFGAAIVLSILSLMVFSACGGSGGGGGGNGGGGGGQSNPYDANARVYSLYSVPLGGGGSNENVLAEFRDSGHTITSISISGPGIPTDHENDWSYDFWGYGEEYWFFWGYAYETTPTLPATYTLTIIDAQGTHTVTRTVTTYIMSAPSCISPADYANVSNPVALQWQTVSITNFKDYYAMAINFNTDEVACETPDGLAQPQYTCPTMPAAGYLWTCCVRDKAFNQACSGGDFNVQ